MLFCPQAVTLPAREELYQTYHDCLRSVLLNFTNAAETADLGKLLIEIGALARTFPSEADLALQILSHVETATHLQPTIGTASNKFTAHQAARQCLAQGGRVIKELVLPLKSDRKIALFSSFVPNATDRLRPYSVVC